jgi:hypothetical protein
LVPSELVSQPRLRATIVTDPTKNKSGNTDFEPTDATLQAANGGRYSFTLKRSSNPSGNNSNARTKTFVLPADLEKGDARQASKLYGQTLKKDGVHKHESRKGDAEPAIKEVQKVTSQKMLTRSKVKTN